MPQTVQRERYRANVDFTPSARFAPSFQELLDSGDLELMRGPLRGWLARGDRAGATDVYGGWLKAGGEPGLIRESLMEWLAGNAAAAREASFVYSAWLQATGEVGLVRDALGSWVELHGDDPMASFLYCDWLSAGGEPQAFSGPICDWLAAHTNDDEGRAHHLYSAWLQHGGEPSLVARSLERWQDRWPQ